MKIFHGTDNANILRPTVLTLGVFDGLHLGHQRIMQTVVNRAKAVNAVPTVITFDPHPRAVLHPENAPPLLQTLDQRLANFEVLGIEQAIVIRFDREFAAIDAETFLRDIVYERLQAKEVYLGKGFFFGKNRGGNIELLREMSRKLGFYADDAFFIAPGIKGANGSTEIRQAYANGLADPNFAINFASDKIDVASSGDLAYSRGHFTEKFTDPKTQQVMTTSGSFLTVFKKQQDGSWKAEEDVAASDADATKPAQTGKPATHAKMTSF